ncbi:acetamidase [Actinomadura sp. NBRC 104412]|uniref:acetamidase/formamidase family protein n=1 Tax=Actinomadura sp. NBRC 104412 TaxID=3032203 RepID=UPI0024A5FC72|nr:acetamidase/formamidase family protein [Actinomadura sp. NBRC 104412]GLZ06471.1 acetamidase [Actinomadura sp. NBRC 104412]
MVSDGARASELLRNGLGRRGLFRAAAALGVAGVVGGAGRAEAKVLQPRQWSNAYLGSSPETVSWGFLPNRTAKPVLRVGSGSIVTVDTVSHEGILEDQGRDPVAFFGDHGVPEGAVLRDARAIAASDLEHDFDADGPHVVTGPIAVRGARPGDVLKIDVLDLKPRVPYGVVSNRHGKGALPGEYPESIKDDPETRPYLNEFQNISVFTPVKRGHGVMPGVRFPLDPFMGIMGVATDTAERVHSVPPTIAGGNLDINELGVGSTLYLPVQVPEALFFVGDPHYAQGDGEVALTALEGSLRGTFRLTVIKPGGKAPEVAFEYPFAEDDEYWIPIGLSDPDGGVGGQVTSLDVAMKVAVRNAIAFLHEELRMPKAVAYAYLSAAADFEVSQVVDRTTGIHALIRKADFDRRPGR